jgi:hypothetical protein
MTKDRPQKKVTRAFKIDESLDREISEQARKTGITPSSLVSHVLGEFTEWGRYTGKGTNFLTIDTEIFKSLIQELSEDKIVEIARSSALVETHNFLKFRYHTVNQETVLSFIETLSSHANIGEASIVSDDNGDHHYEINFRHPLGINWSIFLSEYVQGMLSSFLDMQTSSEVSPSGCFISARKKQEQ